MESDIPFPLLAGQWASVMVDGEKKFVKIKGQPKFFDLTFTYEIGAGLTLSDQAITLGTGSGSLSAFRTDYLKEWVTWIDNKYLGVTWVLNSTRINSLNSFEEPQNAIQTPYGSVNFPLFIYKNTSGNVTFSLVNNSLTKTIRGTLHILMYDYQTDKEVTFPKGQEPAQYTETYYGGNQQ